MRSSEPHTHPSVPPSRLPAASNAAGPRALADDVHEAASGAFIHGLSAGCLVAGGVALAGAIMAAILLPAQPSPSPAPAPASPGHQPAQAQPAEAAAVLVD